MGGTAPPDYKFFVFGGVVHYVEVDFDRATNHTQAFFDRNWVKQPFRRGHPIYEGPIPRPAALDEMIAVAEKIGAPFDFARVDLYDVDGSPRFGEVTFYPGGGTGAFIPDEYDRIFGRLWKASPPTGRPSRATT